MDFEQVQDFAATPQISPVMLLAALVLLYVFRKPILEALRGLIAKQTPASAPVADAVATALPAKQGAASVDRLLAALLAAGIPPQAANDFCKSHFEEITGTAPASAAPAAASKV